MGRKLELTAADGFRLGGYRADPAGSPHGGIVVLQEIFGVNAHMQSVCDRYAAAGYVALAPALFDRAARDVELGYGPDERTRGQALRGAVAVDASLLDVAAARDALAADVAKVAVVGFCWGGTLAWLAAGRLAGFACAVAYYGGGVLATPDLAPQCPVQMHFGERDAHIPIDGVRAFAAAHPGVEVYTYPADHGFNRDVGSAYDPAAAALAAERTAGFLQRFVG